MSTCYVQTDGTVATIFMNNGTNRHNPQFATDLQECLKQVIENEQHSALILASATDGNWSQGIDVEWLMPAMHEKKFTEVKDFMYAMDDIFKTLLLYPIPVIAAINGHAFGNGAILSCACDFRLMRADKGFFCFPEVDLSIPFLPGMIAFVKKAMPYYRFNEMKLTGRRVTADELASDHVIEKSCATAEQLQQDAMAFASQFNKKRGIFAEHKKRLHSHIINVIEQQNKPLIDALQLMVK